MGLGGQGRLRPQSSRQLPPLDKRQVRDKVTLNPSLCPLPKLSTVCDTKNSSERLFGDSKRCTTSLMNLSLGLSQEGDGEHGMVRADLRESGCFWRHLVLPKAPEEARKWRHLTEAWWSQGSHQGPYVWGAATSPSPVGSHLGVLRASHSLPAES